MQPDTPNPLCWFKQSQNKFHVGLLINSHQNNPVIPDMESVLQLPTFVPKKRSNDVFRILCKEFWVCQKSTQPTPHLTLSQKITIHNLSTTKLKTVQSSKMMTECSAAVLQPLVKEFFAEFLSSMWIIMMPLHKE